MTWSRFERRGTVTALRLPQPFRWTTELGDELVADAGDWRVTDGRRVWTVADDCFRRSYEAVVGGYRRCGVVKARPGQDGEVIRTREGDVRVRGDDWVVEGVLGEFWPVPAAHFASAYASV